jgi:hypothetical protein
MPFDTLGCEALTGLELWSFLNDTLEPAETLADVARFVASPDRVLDHPPARNLAAWDRLCAARPVVALGGLDAHQIGIRVAGHVPLRLMGYARSFRYLRTHVLCEELPTGDAARDARQVYAALRAGRCYIARDSLAPARGFAFWAAGPGGAVVPMGTEEQAGDWTLHARAPRPALLRLVRDGELVAELPGSTLEHPVEGGGVYRVEARLPAYGRPRTWVVSNPIYLR